MIIIISSPSGGGKTTIINALLKGFKGVRKSVSFTTREPREGERNRRDYNFVSKKGFLKKIERKEFVEWEKVFGNYYGTSKARVKKAFKEGDDIILSIDVKGARQVKKAHPESVSIFILPPSMEELVKRLKRRNTEKKEEVKKRLKESEKEIEAAGQYDYLIVNRDVQAATRELEGIVKRERDKRKNKK